MHYQKINNNPALFVPVEGKWIDKAFDYFKEKNILYFYTDSHIGIVKDLPIKKVFFKRKGDKFVSAVAEFVDITTENPINFRLKDNENIRGKYFYGFKNLKLINNTIRLNNLEYFKSGKKLMNDVPGVCLIKEPKSNFEDHP